MHLPQADRSEDPKSRGDGTNIQRISNPLFKVSLPGDVEQVARCPQEDDGQMTEVRSKNLLIKILLRHAIVGLKVMSGGNTYQIRRVVGS
jgi:hypothetical protein